jgi:hypothetical protein
VTALGVCAGLVVVSADGADPAIALILPGAAETRPWVPDGQAQIAEGQELFALINGGAELFLRYGFERAAVQSYNLGGGRQIQVEVYQMRTPDGATEVFTRKVGPGDLPLTIGDAGVRGEYYIIFRRGRFLITVAAGDAHPDAKTAVLRIARAVEKRIPATCP